MSFKDQLDAALATWQREQAEADAAKSAYDALAAQQVKDGPDLSQFQATVDFTKLGAGFCFLRAADGDVRDPTYAPRVTAARAAGIPLAPYYFGRVAAPGNNERNGRVEAGMATYFASSAGWGTGDLPLAYDFETLNGQPAAKAAKHLMQFIKTYAWIMQHNPIVYTNPATTAQVVPELSDADKATLAACPLWIAHWNVPAPTVPAPWNTWTFWQFTSSGTTPGTTGNIDLNHYAGGANDLAALRV